MGFALGHLSMQDVSSAPTEKAREENLKLQTTMTDEVKKYSDSLIEKYKIKAIHIFDLKEAMNEYVYRPTERTAINKD